MAESCGFPHHLLGCNCLEETAQEKAEKVVINADEYAAMRNELVKMYQIVWGIYRRKAKEHFPIAAKLSEEDGGNG